jgi:hypothetical protein
VTLRTTPTCPVRACRRLLAGSSAGVQREVVPSSWAAATSVPSGLKAALSVVTSGEILIPRPLSVSRRISRPSRLAVRRCVASELKAVARTTSSWPRQAVPATPAGFALRIAQRLLALTLGMLLNTLARRPARALAAYDGR